MSDRPNIVLILADDLGFSDIGCYGSEIRTPNLDVLGRNGLRFTQMYNSARCCPSRAALLTGIHPHQAGVGHMARDLGNPSYQGYLNESSVTIAEVLRGSGYRTLMSGKWHVGGDHFYPNDGTTPGDPGYPVPRQRGFDRYYGILGGAGSYFNPQTLLRDDTPVVVETTDYYLTDAISDAAVEMVRESATGDAPFFLYVAYTAPHWPLHALEEDIARYEGRYRGGWDALRTSRHEQMIGMGLVDSRWEISPRDPDAPPWKEAADRDWEDLRMAVYAAQVDRMDQGIGRIMAELQAHGLTENTLVMFLADNGGCPELLMEDTNAPEPSRYAAPTVDGKPVRLGNRTDVKPGPADTFMSYDLPWANASNAPFRLYKRWVHEGGISTPFLVHWPQRVDRPGIVHAPAHITDIAATCLEAAGATYPGERNGHAVTPLEGESLLPAIESGGWTRQKPIFWEHEGNRAVRVGRWKLVSEYPRDWELYDVEEDRTELNNLADRDPQTRDELADLYHEWADRCGVLTWPLRPEITVGPLRGGHAHICAYGSATAGTGIPSV